jgi:hypothetical protein
LDSAGTHGFDVAWFFDSTSAARCAALAARLGWKGSRWERPAAFSLASTFRSPSARDSHLGDRDQLSAGHLPVDATNDRVIDHGVVVVAPVAGVPALNAGLAARFAEEENHTKE